MFFFLGGIDVGELRLYLSDEGKRLVDEFGMWLLMQSSFVVKSKKFEIVSIQILFIEVGFLDKIFK